MVRGEDSDNHIRNWMRNRNTVEYLGLWETLNNPGFKSVEFVPMIAEIKFKNLFSFRDEAVFSFEADNSKELESLHKELPGLRGFSAANIKKMRVFFEEWHPVINRSFEMSDLNSSENKEDKNDFSFIGNQFRIEVDGEDSFIDLLFFNRELNALVAIELKSGKFRPSYLGQLNFYLSALDEYVRKPYENQYIN